MANVVRLNDNTSVEDNKPNPALIEALKSLVTMAESGQLQSFIGTGFLGNSLRVSTWCDYHQDVYQQLGALAWLQHEYVERQTK